MMTKIMKTTLRLIHQDHPRINRWDNQAIKK